MTMAMKMENVSEDRRRREGKRVFSFMNMMAWIALGVGVVMSVANLGYLSEENLPLMLGIGFLVGSVFIYTIGTAISMVEQRKQDNEADEKIE